jgi:hypothetical protein
VPAALLIVILSLVVATNVAAQGLIETPRAVADRDRIEFYEADDQTNVLGAVGDSLKLLFIEHATRIAFQEKTRRGLEGPFWEDYRRSVRIPAKWEDGDPWYINYVGHTLHGAAASRIWLNHTPARDTPITELSYWSSRGRATAFAAIYSLQFEFGPLSEASIGNVGLDPETAGWVDHLVTPAGAFAFIVIEDTIDHYFVRWVERHTGNRFFRASLRMIFNPSRVLSNIAQSRAPWHRPGRPLGN